jgi:hypothetical protein
MLAAGEVYEGMHHVKIMVAESSVDGSVENLLLDKSLPEIRYQG